MSLAPTLGSTVARRRRLHEQYASFSGLTDASRLAFLHGQRVALSADDLATAWDAAPAQWGGSEVRTHLYVHVPFCKSICTFCNYVRLRPASKDALDDYVERVCAQIAHIAPHARHLEVSSIYFGGGTPSVLAADQLDRVMTALDTSFRFHPDTGRHLEFDPAVLTKEKLDVAVSHGFRRYSFGIQSLDEAVNVAHNRGAQSRTLLQRRFDDLRAAKVDERSCDILLGLAGTEPAQMVDEIGELLRSYQPDLVNVFMLTPTQTYIDAHFDGDPERFWSHLRRFEHEALPRLGEVADAGGYEHQQGGGHVVRLARRGRKMSRRFRTYTPLSHLQGMPVNVLAFGPSARGSIYGALQFQHMQGADGWFTEGYRLTLEDEARSHLCMELRDEDQIDPVLFRRLHQTDFVSRFPLAAAVLAEAGLFDGEWGFRPQPRLERTRALMWLVDEERIEEEVSRHLNCDLRAEGVARWLHPLRPGQALPGGTVIDRFEDRRVFLRQGTALLGLRLAPPWQEGETPRVIALTSDLDAPAAAWVRDVRVLQRLMERNR